MTSKSAAPAAAAPVTAAGGDAASASSSSSSSDSYYYDYNDNAMALIRKERPWEHNVKHYQQCKISALAAMKMLKHSLAGVEKGRKNGTNPIEVMGLMIGKADGDSIIVLDCCPLPVEGSETRVVADDAQVYMTQLMDSMELRRKEGFVGWYHSHPFDVETYSHCHLSAIDVQTQTGWQLASGTWTSIVVDPLRSLAKQEPEFGCFRVYPPKHTPPPNECPDGSINTDAPSRTTRWGLSFHRYYQLKHSFFMSGLGNQMLEIMSKNALWVRILGSSSIMEPDNRVRFADRIKKTTERLQSVDASSLPMGAIGSAQMGPGMGSMGLMGPHMSMMGGSGSLASLGLGGSARGSARMARRHGSHKHAHTTAGGDICGANDDLTKASISGCELAIEQCKGHSSQIIKDIIFNYLIKKQNQQSATAIKGATSPSSPTAKSSAMVVDP